jgi:hypothetical protein
MQLVWFQLSKLFNKDCDTQLVPLDKDDSSKD